MTGTEPRHEQVNEALELDVRKASRKLRHGLISLTILVVLVVGLLLAVPGLHDVAHKVARMPAGLIVLAICLEILSCASYVIAFLQVFDRAPIRFGARVALSELAFGAAVSLGGAGSVAVGALMLVERGASPGVVVKRSAVLFLLTSAINLITLALAGFAVWFGILPGTSNALLSLVPAVVAVVAFFGFMALPWLTDRFVPEGHPGHLAAVARTTSETVRATMEVLFTTDWRLIGAFGFLWFDIGVLAVCFWATGHTPPLTTIVLAYQIGYLSNFLPIPGGIGVLDGSFVGMFVLFGVAAAPATSATLVYHAISLWVPATWGTVAFLMLQRSRGQPVTLRPPREERRAQRHRAV